MKNLFLKLLSIILVVTTALFITTSCKIEDNSGDNGNKEETKINEKATHQRI